MLKKLYSSLFRQLESNTKEYIWVDETPYRSNLSLIDNSILAIEKKLLGEYDNGNFYDFYGECLNESLSKNRLSCYCGDIIEHTESMLLMHAKKDTFYKMEVI